ncbi:MAG: DNA replication protein RecF [Cycloclasticus sp. symbiont of Bathymodiolus heckerae]|nr:MAG: DNA replication protein RecF [Cycloclasticus sp. symbiont of Bathymodiolus heckerae]
MSLVDIQIQDVRNINRIHFQPSAGLNIIVGPNGSGKTSLLESLYILSRARSFRTQNINKVLSHGKSKLIVFSKLDDGETIKKIAIQKNKVETVIRINGKTEKKASELSKHLHTHLIRPESQALLEGGSTGRRSFIDLGVFHVKHSFLEALKNYNLCLKNRNKLLKQKEFKTLPVWGNKLAEYGIIITTERSAYVERFELELNPIVKILIGDVEVDVKYTNGWLDKVTLPEALERSLEKDKRYGYTTTGAHKADLKIFIDGNAAQDYLSRGRMKLLVIAMYLAQIKLMGQIELKSVCVLLDDLAAELDVKSFRKVMLFLVSLGIQVFVTTTNEKAFLGFIGKGDAKLFHVKHGAIF